MLEAMARDCPPLQFLREFTRNAIEAIEAYGDVAGPDYRGEIMWTLDRNLFDLTGQRKLCCIDTGIGMAADELPLYINNLAASGKAQALDKNYGIGAKVSAGPQNPDGLIYCSWKEGVGSMVELRRDEHTNVWGLRQYRLDDGTVSSVLPLSDDVKPQPLRDIDHGTMVVFMGTGDADDTTQPPAGSENRDRWIAKALNQRFYRIPPGVEVKAAETKVGEAGDESFLRSVRGQEDYLDRHTAISGLFDITEARVHWRILDDDHERRKKQGSVWASTGHRAALFQDELFELATAARGGYQRVQEFGVNFGYERVVLYVEPRAPGRSVTMNTSRTRVLIDGEPLPWDRYAAEFAEKMPQELREFQERIASGAATRGHRNAIRERLAPLAELFRVSRYRPEREGAVEASEPNAGGVPGDRRQTKRVEAGDRAGSGGGTGGSVYALFERRGGTRAERVKAEALPELQVDWVSVHDGTRTAPHLEDRAARYDIRRNRLEINADFRGHRDLVDRWRRLYAGVAGAEALVEEEVSQWIEQALTETVYGVLGLRGSEWWHDRDVSNALGTESLSASVMQRYHVDVALRRELGRRLGPARAAA